MVIQVSSFIIGTISFTQKTIIMKSFTKPSFNKWTLLAVISLLIFSSCQKQIDKPLSRNETATAANSNSEHGHLQQTNTYPSEVAIKWMDMQLELFRTTAGLFPHQNRYVAYCGLALYESVVPGMPAYQSIASQLNGLPAMPSTEPGFAYHWPTCANAALAYMNKHFFAGASATNIAAMNALENNLNTTYQGETDAETFQHSVDFGKAVAEIIFNWSQTDGSATVYPAFIPAVPPIHLGDWVPTPPAFANTITPITPYWGNIRLFVPGSLENSNPPPPLPYSTDPNSDYYKMHKEVYDVSLTLTPEQIALALYWRDNPGFSGPGHYMNIAKLILLHENSMLDMAALTYAKVGITQADASVGSIGSKYNYYTERPITYIRSVLGYTTWNALFNTPAFPDYPSTHSTDCGAVGEALSELFGANYQFTDNTYDYLGMTPRDHNGFQHFFDEMIDARVYAGIHTRNADIAGVNQGRKIAQNINSKLKFLKE
jgi:hypothetical protein